MAEEELNSSLEYTPTWIVAAVCSIIVLISLCAERGLHRLGKFLENRGQDALYRALQKLKEELMLLGFISLLLTVFQGLISHICVPTDLVIHMLPCKRSTHSSEGPEHDQFYYNTIINRRRLFSTEASSSEHCKGKGEVPLLSLESLHHLHIFIFVLAIVHAVFCVTTMLLGGARIRQWKRWEDFIRNPKVDDIKKRRHHEFFKTHADGYWRRAAVVGWLIAFSKQFYGSVTETDYFALRRAFIEKHKLRDNYDFHAYMMRTLEYDFKKIVGISWYLWVFVVLFLLLNLYGWHTYFWLAFLPLILLLLVGAKLEHIIARLAQETSRKFAGENQAAQGQFAEPLKLSDERFWFNRPSLVLDLIHFILFQNAFEIAFFFWILCTYGFDSCIMEKLAFIIPRLIMGVIVQVLSSYSSLPLYAIVTQFVSTWLRLHKTSQARLISIVTCGANMGDSMRVSIFPKGSAEAVRKWFEEQQEPQQEQPQSQNLTKEATQDIQSVEQAVVMIGETTASAIELPFMTQEPSSTRA